MNELKYYHIIYIFYIELVVLGGVDCNELRGGNDARELGTTPFI